MPAPGHPRALRAHVPPASRCRGAQLRALFEAAVRMAPSVVFIDEIDSIAPKREASQRGMERRIVAQLLTCLDSLNEPRAPAGAAAASTEGSRDAAGSEVGEAAAPDAEAGAGAAVAPSYAPVIVIGATNRADSLDAALRRAGRFDREICLGIPDEGARARILRVMAGKCVLRRATPR